MSQTALCSRTKRVCSIDRPTHQLRLKPVSSTPVLSTGSVPSLFTRILPSRPLRRRSCVAWSLP